MAWNVERGRRPDLWLAVPAIAAADVLLLTEVDRGMARTGNRHVARELAERLGMAYAFGPAFRELTRGRHLERLRTRGQSDAEALHGVAVLSRLPIRRAEVIGLPTCYDWTRGFERRSGRRIALIAHLEHASGPLVAVATHLENKCAPAGRTLQFQALLDGLPPGRCVVGGDLNTTTTSLKTLLSPLPLIWGVPLRPSRLRDPVDFEPLFALAERHAFDYRKANLCGTGTGVPHWAWIPRWLRPRVDWILTRGIEAVAGTAAVYETPRNWMRLSEHDGVGVRLRLG